MLPRARGTWAALAFGSTVTVGLVFGTVCSVDRAGLSNGDASVSSGGSGGGMLSTGLGGLGSGGRGGGGSGGNGSGGAGNGGSVGSGGVGSESGIDSGAGQGDGAGGATAGGTGGVSSGAGGSDGTAGTSGAGGIIGTGGQTGTGGGGPTGTGGATNDGGPTGTGGLIGTGGAVGTGGLLGTGGALGAGGEAATGGAVGTGGNHPPSCSPFPAGSSFTTPTDGLLHCYWIHSDVTDWDSSESRCVSEGGTLATILSSQENMFVLQVLLQAALFKGDGVSLGATDGKANDDKSGAGQYAWVTGEPWGSYINWHMGQPDGSCMCPGGNNCACDHRMVMINDGTWEARAPGTTRPYLCEAVAR
jgi:hypothetical protein